MGGGTIFRPLQAESCERKSVIIVPVYSLSRNSYPTLIAIAGALWRCMNRERGDDPILIYIVHPSVDLLLSLKGLTKRCANSDIVLTIFSF